MPCKEQDRQIVKARMGRALRFPCFGDFAEEDDGYGFELAAGVANDNGVLDSREGRMAVYKAGKRIIGCFVGVKRAFYKRLAIWIAIVVAVAIAVFGLLF